MASITLILQVRVEDVKPAGFKRLIHLIYNSRCLSWKMDDPEEWWYVLEAANKYMNIRLVQQIERQLRHIARKEGGKGVILSHLQMAYRIGFDSAVKTVFLNSVIKNTSKLIQTDLCRQQRLPGPGRLVQGLDNQDLGEERQREHDQRQLQTNMVNPKTCKTLQLLNCSLFRFFTSSSTQSRKAARPHSSKKKLPLLTSLRR